MTGATPESGRRLTEAQLARETDTPPEYVGQLLRSGAIRPGADGHFGVDDIPRVRLAQALAAGGIDVDDLLWAIESGILPLDRFARLWAVADPTGRTFAEFAATLGERASALPELYAAFGLAVPPPEAVMRHDEEAAITEFLDAWATVDDRPELFLRAARIAGEGVRRIQIATLDLFDEFGGSPPPRLRRGLSQEEAAQPSIRLGSMVPQLLVWLQTRHAEHEVFDRVVAFIEGSLARAGRSTGDGGEPPAIAFVDLTGYTALTAEAGDEQAAGIATTLQVLAGRAASAHGGRVVKLLGDGVMLRFRSAVDAVLAVRVLMRSIADSAMPAAHAGIAAGPLVVRDGDVYGHTVNLASRIASLSPAGCLLVERQVAERLAAAGIESEDEGEAQLKGITEPVRLARVVV